MKLTKVDIGARVKFVEIPPQSVKYIGESITFFESGFRIKNPFASIKSPFAFIELTGDIRITNEPVIMPEEWNIQTLGCGSAPDTRRG